MLPVVSSCKQTNSLFYFLAKRSCQSCFYHITPRVAVRLLLLLWLSDWLRYEMTPITTSRKFGSKNGMKAFMTLKRHARANMGSLEDARADMGSCEGADMGLE